jgi:hypothetical protein
MKEEVNPSVVRVGELSRGEGDVDIPRHDRDPFCRTDRGWGGFAIEDGAEGPF